MLKNLNKEENNAKENDVKKEKIVIKENNKNSNNKNSNNKNSNNKNNNKTTNNTSRKINLNIQLVDDASKKGINLKSFEKIDLQYHYLFGKIYKVKLKKEKEPLILKRIKKKKYIELNK